MTLKNILPLIAALMTGFVDAQTVYSYSVDLRKPTNDRINVELTPPPVEKDSIEFLFPAMVPGTYEVYDFGRFVSGFTASGADGSPMKIRRKDANTYVIYGARGVKRISYETDDTFDPSDRVEKSGKVVFEPGGTSFEDNKNFSINPHTMFGYYRGMLKMPFEIHYTKPEGFYPSTGLSSIKTGSDKDVITAADYHELADSPVMYSKPDTTTVQVANTKVLVSVYSPNNKINSTYIASSLRDLLRVQQDYLGGELPVSKYAFLFYFADQPTQSGASGALEHSYSSFYVLPEFDSSAIAQQIRDVAAHEFFHIVTPLGIHSEEIGNFDFNNPKMSRHLWLYEGMTEYAAHHAQVSGGLIGLNDFLTVMMQKYANSVENYNDTMSFTWMSRHVLDPKVHEQYGNVYEKGALIGMCLDILLRDLSQGRYGTQELMKDLSRKYGKNKSFKDDSLFVEIERLTFPEVGAFLRRHVSGHEPLPMRDILGRVGIKFDKEVESFEFTLGNPGMNFNQTTRRIVVEETDDLDEFGKKLGYKPGDELNTLNGMSLDLQNLRETITNYYSNIKEGDKVIIEIYRPKKKEGKYKKKKLTANAQKVKTVKKYQVNLIENLTEQQKNTLRTWIGL